MESQYQAIIKALQHYQDKRLICVEPSTIANTIQVAIQLQKLSKDESRLIEVMCSGNTAFYSVLDLHEKCNFRKCYIQELIKSIKEKTNLLHELERNEPKGKVLIWCVDEYEEVSKFFSNN